MNQVVKVVIIDNPDTYLLLKRSDHPRFPNDPDLPGGTIEIGEDPVQALIREVTEETGVMLRTSDIVKKYTGDEFSAHKTIYYLYEAHLASRPTISISWEHAAYAWVNREVFLSQAKNATDTYMQMVYEVMRHN